MRSTTTATRLGLALFLGALLFTTGATLAKDGQAASPIQLAQVAPKPSNTPAAPAAAPLTQLIFFDYEQATIGNFAQGMLDTIAKQSVTAKEVYIVAHTDSAEPKSDALSLARATALRAALVGRGVPAHKIAMVAAGATQQLVPTAQGAKEPQNRRASITVYP